MKIHKALNPRGAIAKEMEMGLRRAIHLEHLCELWLMYHQGDHRIASSTTPYVPPPHIGAVLGIGWDDDLSKALGKALKGTDLWEWQRAEAPRSRFRMLKSGPKVTPAPPQARSWARLVSWPQVFFHWESGALERGINDSMQCLPKENRKRLKALRDGG